MHHVNARTPACAATAWWRAGNTTQLPTSETSTIPLSQHNATQQFNAIQLRVSQIRVATDPMALGVQLAEVRFFDGRRVVPVARASTISGNGTAVHDAAAAIDGSLKTKWFDSALLGPHATSTLELALSSPSALTTYEIIAAADWPARDPRSWSLWGRVASDDVPENRRGGGDGGPEWLLLDEQAPFDGKPPLRLSSFGRLHLPHFPGSGFGALRQAQQVAPLLLFDAAGQVTPVWRDAVANLADLQGQLVAIQAVAGISALEAYDEPAFAGRATRVAITLPSVTLALPDAVSHGARSLRLLWATDGVALIHGSGEGDGSMGAAYYSHRMVHGDARRSGEGFPDGEWVATAGVRHTVRVAVCLSSAVHGAVLYPAERFAGRPTVLWRGATDGSTPVGHACMCMPWLPHSIRVVGKADALMIGGDGVVEVARISSANRPIATRSSSTAENGSGSGCSEGVRQDATAVVLAVCGGAALQAVELFSQAGWHGRSAMLTPSVLCVQRVPAALLRLGGVASFRLHHRVDTASLLSPPYHAAIARTNGSCTIVATATAATAKQRVLSADVASLVLTWRVVSVRLGRSVTSISLFSMPYYAGERLLLSNTSGAACPIGGGDVLVAVPEAWQRAVASVVVHRVCNSHGLLCPPSLFSAAEGDDMTANGAARVVETEVPSFGEVLAFRARGAPVGVPASLRKKHGFFHAYNPTLLAARGGGSVQVICRLSNYHFCTNRKRFDENVRDARGVLMSLVAHADLNLSSWDLQRKDFANTDRGASSERGDSWRLWGEVNALSSITANELVSGPEDPRALQLDDGSVLVFVAAWEATGIQWQHVIEIPVWPGGRHGSASGGSNGARSTSGLQSMRNALSKDGIAVMRLEVDLRYAHMLRGWLPQFWQAAQLQREKNWSPFTFAGEVYLEYSLQPRLVLLLNRRTGACTPVLPLSSSRGVQAWLDQLGPISGGPPSVYVAGHGVYLGLAHVKLWKKQGRGTATSAMIYKHVWCEEHAQPPSSPHTSSPHKQPSCTPNHHARPVATGTPLRRRRPFVFWASHRLSLSRRNCHQRRQSSSRPAC